MHISSIYASVYIHMYRSFNLISLYLGIYIFHKAAFYNWTDLLLDHIRIYLFIYYFAIYISIMQQLSTTDCWPAVGDWRTVVDEDRNVDAHDGHDRPDVQIHHVVRLQKNITSSINKCSDRSVGSVTSTRFQEIMTDRPTSGRPTNRSTSQPRSGH